MCKNLSITETVKSNEGRIGRPEFVIESLFRNLAKPHGEDESLKKEKGCKFVFLRLISLISSHC